MWHSESQQKSLKRFSAAAISHLFVIACACAYLDNWSIITRMYLYPAAALSNVMKPMTLKYIGDVEITIPNEASGVMFFHLLCWSNKHVAAIHLQLLCSCRSLCTSGSSLILSFPRICWLFKNLFNLHDWLIVIFMLFNVDCFSCLCWLMKDLIFMFF